MEYTSIAISILAFGMSVFTFYWLNIREKRNFYLLRIDRMTGDLTPEFALVNGGSKHILITAIECGFEEDDGSSVHYPAQRIEHGKNESLLIQSGSAIHCKVNFPHPFTSSFAKSGKLRENTTTDIYMFKFIIDISWVDSHGDNFDAAAHVKEGLGGRCLLFFYRGGPRGTLLVIFLP